MHQIGAGAVGPVFRAYDPAGDRIVAVKVFHLDFTPEQAQTLIDALTRLVDVGLTHQAIVMPLAAGLEGGVPYLAQEYVAARSLDVAMRHYAPVALDTALSYVSQLASAMDAAHTRGVVHGGVHLRDVFVTLDDIRVSGFGVAKALEDVGVHVPVRRPYTAPEVIAGRACSPEADRFAVAAIAYELLTGQRAAGAGKQMVVRLDEVSVEDGGDREALRDVFATALSDVPTVRYATVGEFGFALADAIGLTGPTAEGRVRGQAVQALGASASETCDRKEGLQDAVREPLLPLSDVASDDANVETASNLEAPATGDVIARMEAGHSGATFVPAYERIVRATDTRYEMASAPAGAMDPDSGTAAPTLFDDPDTRARAAAFPVSAATVATPPLRSAVRTIPLLATAAVLGILAAYVVVGGLGLSDPISNAGDLISPVDPTLTAIESATASHEWIEGTVAEVPGENLRPADVIQTPSNVLLDPPLDPMPVKSQSWISSPMPSFAEQHSDPVGAPALADAGWLLVRTNAPVADVTVDGVSRGQTPLSLPDIAYGTHQVHVSAAGYVPKKLDVVLSAEESIAAVRVELIRGDNGSGVTQETAVTGHGSVFVDSRPAGARVLVDAAFTGVTPILIPDLPAGSHRVRIERDGYRPWAITIDVPRSEQIRIAASLEVVR